MVFPPALSRLDNRTKEYDGMSEQTNPEQASLISGSMEAVSAVQETLESFLEAADVNAVYAEPIQHGDTLIIPAAEVLSGIGFGMGYGTGESPESEGMSRGSGGGGGGGGGGRVFSRPVAAIIATPDGVRVEPILDTTKIALAALTAAGFMVSMIARMSRGPRDE
jgi:uncharacterized spore protein YtfJ